jgi:hypothetical protein
MGKEIVISKLITSLLETMIESEFTENLGVEKYSINSKNKK